jgi:hypothetical protein
MLKGDGWKRHMIRPFALEVAAFSIAAASSGALTQQAGRGFGGDLVKMLQIMGFGRFGRLCNAA